MAKLTGKAKNNLFERINIEVENYNNINTRCLKCNYDNLLPKNFVLIRFYFFFYTQ